jgi:hypothetical protein
MVADALDGRDFAHRLPWTLPGPYPEADASRIDYDRAEQIAQFITDPDDLAEMLFYAATSAAAAGDYDRAEQIAWFAAGHPYAQPVALAGVAVVAAGVGDYDRAERIARSITSPHLRAQALADVASSTAEPVRARTYIAEALAAGRWSIPLQALAIVNPAVLRAFADELNRSGPGPISRKLWLPGGGAFRRKRLPSLTRQS